MKFQNGKKIYDTIGKVVHAHGGQIFKYNNMFYWIGEDRTNRNKVSCYASEDLHKWEFRNHIFTLDSPKQKHYVKTSYEMEVDGQTASIGIGCNIERPKVIYNEETKQFVMWMHWEKPSDYSQARCAIAVCDTIDGDYTYLGSFNPVGHMSRDCTLFKDTDGTAYFISTARGNADIHIYRLSEDYLSIDEHVKTLWPGQYREAPTVFKRKGIYYMLTSGCTGWKPNQSKYAMADSICGRWSSLTNFGDETTYKSQPTWVLPIKEREEESFIYIGDRWGNGGQAYFDSTYVFCTLEFDQNGRIKMNLED